MSQAFKQNVTLSPIKIDNLEGSIYYKQIGITYGGHSALCSYALKFMV